MARRRHPLALMAAASAAAIGLFGGVAAATATTEGPLTQPPNSLGIRLVDIPTNRVDDPRARTSIIDHVVPGAAVVRRIDLVSTVDTPVDVELYATNAAVRDGAFVPTDAELGMADWIEVSPSSITVPAGGEERVEVTIAVPGSAPTGEQYAIIWAEPPASGDQISILNRVGLRTYLSVGTGDEPAVDFQIGAMTAARDADGVPLVSTQLRNTGGRALDITGELTLSEGPANLAAGPFPFDGSVTLLPGEVGEIVIPLDPELPDGPWLASIRAVSGLLERTAEGQISFPSGAGEEAAPTDTSTTGGTDEFGNDISEELRQQRRTLLPIATALLLFALGALWWLLIWKRRDEEEDDEDVLGASADAGSADGTG